MAHERRGMMSHAGPLDMQPPSKCRHLPFCGEWVPTRASGFRGRFTPRAMGNTSQPRTLGVGESRAAYHALLFQAQLLKAGLYRLELHAVGALREHQRKFEELLPVHLLAAVADALVDESPELAVHIRNPPALGPLGLGHRLDERGDQGAERADAEQHPERPEDLASLSRGSERTEADGGEGDDGHVDGLHPRLLLTRVVVPE
mmetsp:Transcript_45741/g.131937  ORF Transcript_45741/g.131937 Transcript_45741/m.131937 type:complete len:203 (-) Transcript_45741:723-1331(-)